MTKRLTTGVVVSAWLAASLAAANVWESKPFNTWTDKELQKVLTSSPWAGKGSITYVQNRAGQRPIQETAIVTWASAGVMRQALVREEFGATTNVSAEAATIIAQTPPFYMVTVKISNAVNSAGHALRAAEMQNETFLSLRGKPPIPATQAEGQVLDADGRPAEAAEAPADSSGGDAGGPAFAATPAQRGGGGGAGGGGQRGGAVQRGGAGRGAPIGGRRGRGGAGEAPPTTASLVIFRFPRDAITLEDKEVEFVTKLCGGGGFRGAPVAPLPDAGRPQFELAAGAQRGGRGVPGGRIGGIQGGRMGDPLPACNYRVKRTFKFKDMVVKGELSL